MCVSVYFCCWCHTSRLSYLLYNAFTTHCARFFHCVYWPMAFLKVLSDVECHWICEWNQVESSNWSPVIQGRCGNSSHVCLSVRLWNSLPEIGSVRKMRRAADYGSRCQTKPLPKTKPRTPWPAQHCDYVHYDAFSDPVNLTLRPHNSCW